MTHIQSLKASALRKKYAPIIEMLPIQKLTKEEFIESKKTKLDITNKPQIVAFAKNWINCNENRKYKNVVGSCEDYMKVVMDDRLNIAFFHKSGIKETMPEVKSFTRKEMNKFFELVFLDIIPDIISDYEFKRDFRPIKGYIMIEVLNALSNINCCTESALVNRVQSSIDLKATKIHSSLSLAITRGYITYNVEATRKFKTDCFKLSNRVEKIGNKWYFELKKPKV